MCHAHHYCVRNWKAEWKSHRKPLSGYARLIRGERSAPKCVCLTPCASWNTTLSGGGWRHGEWTFSTVWESLNPWTLFLFPSQPLFPVWMGCIISSRFNGGADEEWKRGARAGLRRSRMCQFCGGCLQGDRLKKYFFEGQRKDHVTGELRHHKSAVILSMLFSLGPSPIEPRF